MAQELIPHRFTGAPIFAELVARPNRFLAICRVGRRLVEAHVPDRGRCLDLLVPGQPLVLVRAPRTERESRRTRFTALLARARAAPSPWVSLDPAGAPRLVAAAIERGLFPSLAHHRFLGREVCVPFRGKLRARIDLLFETPGGAQLLCEVKSVGAAREGVALFPDAPTARGSRHLAVLARHARRGGAAAVVFCAQRSDARAIAADGAIDPDFLRALMRARRAGVRVLGLACAAQPEGMELLGEVPVQ